MRLRGLHCQTAPRKETNVKRDLLAILSRDGVAERFWRKVTIGGKNDCWGWNGAQKTIANYTRTYFKAATDVSVSATRAAFVLSNGVNPGELLVCHHCDNSLCCNPRHLYLGTALDNAADKVARRRLWHKSKLDAAKVQAIKNLIAEGFSDIALAGRVDVDRGTIGRIRRGKTDF